MAAAVEQITPAGVESSDVAPTAPALPSVQMQKTSSSKKQKSKSIAARGPTAMSKSRGTGFEPYYAEPPLTRDEFDEETELYFPSIPFEERIETCLQRYRARRRMDSERTLLLNRFLSLGGINCKPRQFNGTAGMEKNLDGYSKAELQALKSTDVVSHRGAAYTQHYASDHKDLWVVDFTSVVSGFLSFTLPTMDASSDIRLAKGIDVVDNFLRYLQIHDVAAEYADDIKRARTVCAKAHLELPNCRDAILTLPGSFHLACVRLFYAKEEHKVFNDGLDPLHSSFLPDVDAARWIYGATLAIHKTGAVTEALPDSDVIVRSTEEVDLEVTSLDVPNDDIVSQFAAQSGEKGALQPTGVVVAKHCTIEEGYANQPHPSAAALEARGEEKFFLEGELMRLLSVGTKLRVALHRLSNGISFVSSVKKVLPSFFVFLPQELMVEWKEPKENDREAPSVDCPDAEEKAMEKALDDDKASA